VLTAATVAACNLINGSRDRVLDQNEDDATPATPRPDADGPLDVFDSGPVEPPPPIVDAGDGGISIQIKPLWRTPNQATFVVNADGSTRITGFVNTEAGTHPVLFPQGQPTNLPSEDYTVHARIKVGQPGEFGILARVQGDGSSVVLSSRFGGDVAPWIGDIRPTNAWNPGRLSKGQNYTFVSTIYRMQLRVSGRTIAGKMWEEARPEPALPQATVEQGPFSTGKGVGYYTYGIADASLESLIVTVP